MTTMLQILDETAVAYTSKTRSIDQHDSCRYFTNGRRCAVGRCLEDPERFSSTCGTVTYFTDLELCLKPEYRGHTLSFWRTLQSLHDNEDYWDENGLSEDGKEKVARIKEEFDL